MALLALLLLWKRFRKISQRKVKSQLVVPTTYASNDLLLLKEPHASRARQYVPREEPEFHHTCLVQPAGASQSPLCGSDAVREAYLEQRVRRWRPDERW